MAGLLTFVTGLGMLLVGLRLMQSGLENLARDRIRQNLLRFAGNPISAITTGFLLTALVQSSTAVSVFAIGFVNTGLMSLPQAIGIILGANVGTCVTVQLMPLDVGHIALPAFIIGGLLILAGKQHQLVRLGQAITGFGLIFLGLELLAQAFTPWAQEPWFLELLAGLRGNHLGAVAAGAAFTGVLHSSATSTGLVIALARENLVDLPTSVAFILGNNVGTCFTALLASVSGSAAGKRVALAHLLINVAGTVIVLPFTFQFAALVQLISSQLPTQVALTHTLFNIASSLAVLPFIHPFARLLLRIVPGDRYRERK